MDNCQGCQALRSEADASTAFYARRLPSRGGAGKLSDTERTYLRHQPPEWYRLALARVPGSTEKAREQTSLDREDYAEVFEQVQAA